MALQWLNQLTNYLFMCLCICFIIFAYMAYYSLFVAGTSGSYCLSISLKLKIVNIKIMLAISCRMFIIDIEINFRRSKQ